MSENVMSGVMPVLALRGLTVFPNQTAHFDVGREKSVRALYRYDASKISVPELFGNISKLPAVEDVELGHEAIEQVIARLYEDWRK